MKLAFARYMQALTRAAIVGPGRPGMLAGDDVADDGMWLRRFLHSPSLRIAGRQRPGPGQHHGGAGPGPAGRAPHRQGRPLPRRLAGRR